jgi:hypothetical protein
MYGLCYREGTVRDFINGCDVLIEVYRNTNKGRPIRVLEVNISHPDTDKVVKSGYSLAIDDTRFKPYLERDVQKLIDYMKEGN